MSIFTNRHHARNPQPRRPQDSFVHRLWNDPYLDWSLMVLFSAVLAGVCIGMGFIAYFNIKGSLAVPATTGSSDTARLFDAMALDRTLHVFDTRAAKHADAQKGYAGVADPSI